MESHTSRRIAWYLLGTLFVIALGLLIVQPACAMTVPVTNTLDSGPGSLRQAVLDAADSDTVVFDSAVFSVPLTITLTGGQIEISKSLTIDGAAGWVVTPTLSGNGSDRLISVAPGVDVALTGLRLTEGNCFAGECDGGAIYNRGHLTVTGSAVFSNSAANGGGVYNAGPDGVVIITDSDLRANKAGVGGGLYNASRAEMLGSLVRDNRALVGGGIANSQGYIAVRNSVISGNGGRCCVGAAGIDNDSGVLEMSDSLVSENGRGWTGGVASSGVATLSGTGVLSNVGSKTGGVLNSGFMTITGALVSGNNGFDGGGIQNQFGDLWLNGVWVTHNTAGETGAGILSWFGGRLYITGSVIRENASPGTGGLFTVAWAEVRDTQITGNQSGGSGGGVLVSGDLLLERSVVAGNTAVLDGGGILNWGVARLINTTISGNTSGGNGGGLAGHESVGVGSLLTNTTIASNTAVGLGGGIYNPTAGAITLTNVLLAHNGDGNCGGEALATGGHNLSDDSTCALTAAGDMTQTDALIAPLDTTSWTHLLLPGSAAIDAGDDDACPPTDARGVHRPIGGHCDIGAYEAFNLFWWMPVIWR